MIDTREKQMIKHFGELVAQSTIIIILQVVTPTPFRGLAPIEKC
jgi:hypothetical protein